MTQASKRHLPEELNRRSVYLRVRRRLWIIPVTMAAAALLCWLVYTLVIVTVHGQRQYRETSVYELSFAQNKDTGKAYDYYNAATWQGLIFTHPGIATTVQQELPRTMSMEEAAQDTKADLISDIRFLSVEVTTKDPQDTAQVSLAIRDGLEHFGETAREFDSITFLSSTDPTLVVVSDRSRNAVLLGLFLGFLLSAGYLYLAEILDDAIYVPEDAERRYDCPVLGVLPGKVRGHGTELPSFLKTQLPMNLTAALQDKERVLVMSLQGTEDAKRVLEELQQFLTDTGARQSGRTGADTMSAAIRCGFVPTGSVDDPDFDRAGMNCHDVIVLLHFGEGSGSRIDNLLGELRKMDFHVVGILLADADGNFLRHYYE